MVGWRVLQQANASSSLTALPASARRYSTHNCLTTVQKVTKGPAGEVPVCAYEAASAARQTEPITKAEARNASQALPFLTTILPAY